MTDRTPDPLDDELRRRAHAARAETEADIEVDAALLATRADDPDPVLAMPNRSSGRAVAIAGSIAAVALAVVAGVVVLRDSDSITSVEPAPTTVSAPVTNPPATAPTTSATPPTTVPGTTPVTTEEDAAPSSDPPSDVLAVDAAAPPPPVDLEPVATLAWDGSQGPSVAIGDLGIALHQEEFGAITVVGFDGQVRTIELRGELLASDLGELVYGPGDVLYAIASLADPPFCCEMVAVALSGERAGSVVARTGPLGVNVIELPPSPLGHGIDGVVLRAREVGLTLMPYVDVDGNEIPLPYTTPHFPTVSDDLVVTTDSFGVVGRLSINGERSPQRAYTGPSVPAPSSGHRTVYPTFLGSTEAEQPPQPPVIAVLESSGDGSWYSIPDGYQYAASDSFGTVFARVDGDRLDLALLAGGPVNWRSLPWEFSGIRSPCDGCTQLLHDRDGTPVTLDTERRVLTRQSIPPVSVALGDEYGAPSLYELGPDDVVYLHVDSPIDDDGDNLAADIVAVSLADGDAGREIGRWVGASDFVGDSELVATRDGLVRVGCCDHAVERPTPGADVVVPWLDRSGNPTRLEGPVMRVEVEAGADRSSLTVHRDDALSGTRSWTFDPGDQWQPRGMVQVIPTFDGGFMATTFHGQGSIVHRGWIDGTVRTLELDDATLWVDALDPSGRFLVANGEWFARVEPFGDNTEYWAGRVDVGDDGSVGLPDIDDAIDDDPAWSRDPVAFANAIAGRPAVNEIRTVRHEQIDDDRFRVVVTTSNFFDDSVAASRLTLDLRRETGGRFRFESGEGDFACQPNRGHQDFGIDLCT